MKKKELLDKIIANRFVNGEIVIGLANDLIELCQWDNDNETLGLAYYYKGEAIVDDEICALESLIQSVNYLTEEKNAELCARAYNIIGILYSHKEDYSSAIQSHLDCIKICDRHNLYYVAGLSSANAGFLFQSIGAFEKAIEYYKRGRKYLLLDGSKIAIDSYAPSLLSNIFACVYYLGDVDSIKIVFRKIRELSALIDPSFVIPNYEACYNAYYGNTDEMKRCARESVKLALEVEAGEVQDYIDNYQFLCAFLFKYEMYDELGQILSLLENALPEGNYSRIKIELAKYSMACYENSKQYDKYIEKAKEYIALYESITSIYHKTINDTLELQLAFDELKVNENKYKNESLTDGLTQLFNRKALNELGENMVRQAKRKANDIAVFIIDIDFFKEYNDNYGHVLGDECLKKVAGVLKSKKTENAIVARFGGDEFVACIDGIDKAEVTRIADEIIADVRDLQIENKYSAVADRVSVSIGCYVGVPDAVWDLSQLIDLADKGLYEAKRLGKNRYEIYK